MPIAYILQALPYVPFLCTSSSGGFIFYYKNGEATSRGRRRRGSSGSRTPGSGALVSTSSTFGPLLFTSGCLLVVFPRNVMRNLSRWLLERLVEAEAFEHCLKPWVSTELLCWRYRFLGCRIGRRVHADFFRCVEFDLVTVEDDVVFGSLVRLAPRADAHLHGVSERIVVRREANVLDHALVLPGCVVGESSIRNVLAGSGAPGISAWKCSHGK